MAAIMTVAMVCGNLSSNSFAENLEVNQVLSTGIDENISVQDIIASSDELTENDVLDEESFADSVLTDNIDVSEYDDTLTEEAIGEDISQDNIEQENMDSDEMESEILLEENSEEEALLADEQEYEQFESYANIPFAGGSGTQRDPYVVTNRAEFLSMLNHKAYKNSYDVYFDVAADITVNADFNEPKLVVSYSGSSPVKKHINFYNHTIKNVWVSGNSGLFWGPNCYIDNLKMENVAIMLPPASLNIDTGLFGKVAECNNCSISGKYYIDLGTQYLGSKYSGNTAYTLGGFASTGRFNNCELQAEVVVTALEDRQDHIKWGGVAYKVQNSNSVVDCKFTGSVNIPNGEAAGIVYAVDNGIVSNCSTSEDAVISANSTDQYVVSGIVGYMSGANAVVEKCVNNASICADESKGTAVGIVGKVSSGTLDSCINYSSNLNGHTICGISNTVATDSNGASLFNCENYADLSNMTTFGSAYGMFNKIGTSIREIDNCVNHGNITASQSAAGIAETIKCSIDSSNAAEAPFITNINNYGDVSAMRAFGLASIISGGYYSDCGNAGKITAQNYAAGFAQFGNARMENCYNEGNVKGQTAYGFIGNAYYNSEASDVKFVHCWNSGDVTADQEAYGLCNGAKDNAIFQSCYNSGNVSSTKREAVGLIGLLNYKNMVISDCYNSGNVTSEKEREYASGLFGYMNADDVKTYTITNCYNVGEIKATKGFAGAIVGSFYNDKDTYNIDASGIYFLDNVADAVGTGYYNKPFPTSTKCSASDMKKMSTYKEFDFDGTWTIDASTGYPYPMLLGKKIDGAPFTITLNANGGVCDVTELLTNDYGKIAGALPTPSAVDGYAFVGWSNKADSFAEVTAGTTFKENAIIYAYYVKASKITFDSNGGSAISETLSLYPGREYGTLPSAERDGYTFAGWYTAKKNGIKVEANTVFEKFTDQVLYALWTPNEYDVLLDARGGVVSESAIKVLYGEKYGELAVPFSQYMTFDGWFTAP